MNDDTLQYTLLKSVHDSLTEGYRTAHQRLSILATLIERELTSGRAIDIPWQRRLWLWRHGFTSRSAVLFDIDESNHHEFVSDSQHEMANDINDPWSAVVNNKLTSYLLFHSFSDHLPQLYGVVDNGILKRSLSTRALLPGHEDRSTLPSTNEPDATDGTAGVTWIDSYLDANEALVLKPIYGSGGRGVLVCRESDETSGYIVNGESKTGDEFATLVNGLEEYLVTEFVDQADYATDLFSESTNTLRILTLWDEEADEPFVAGAIHRIGTRRSAPVDNWSRGGLSADVSDAGELSRGAQWLPSKGKVRWYDTHPDAGARITGVHVPDWPAVRARIEEMAAAFPYFRRLGWDVVLTDDGEFVVLEVNAHAATRTFQVHRPLLRDPRIRQFYDRHGCL